MWRAPPPSLFIAPPSSLISTCYVLGLDVVNYDLYPDESFQKVWLRMYLEERALLTGKFWVWLGGGPMSVKIDSCK